MAFVRVGYGQVEPNQLSAQKTGQIYASLPLDKEVTVLQNGEFMFYDYADGVVTANQTLGKGTEPMLVFNEVKLYEEPYRTSYKNFAMIRVDEYYVTSDLAAATYGDGASTTSAAIESPYRLDGIAPRVFKTNVGDIMTTNMVDLEGTYAVGDLLGVKKNATSKTLVLCPEDSAEATIPMRWQVVKVYTMPDGQAGLKIQRVI